MKQWFFEFEQQQRRTVMPEQRKTNKVGSVIVPADPLEGVSRWWCRKGDPKQRPVILLSGGNRDGSKEEQGSQGLLVASCRRGKHTERELQRSAEGSPSHLWLSAYLCWSETGLPKVRERPIRKAWVSHRTGKSSCFTS